MDYKDKYLQLKQHILEKENTSPKKSYYNVKLMDELSKLNFVLGNKIMGADINAVILSLIEEFTHFASGKLNHNVEISQYYRLGDYLRSKDQENVCDNCELVLRYVDNAVCVSNIKNINGDINCNISRGSVKFYVKTKKGSAYVYDRLYVVRSVFVQSLDAYFQSLYQNTDFFHKMEEKVKTALGTSQAEAVLSLIKSGKFEDIPREDISKLYNLVINDINQIIKEAGVASSESQLKLIMRHGMLSLIPDQKMIDVANVVASAIMTDKGSNEKYTAILVPGNNPIPLIFNDAGVNTIIGNQKSVDYKTLQSDTLKKASLVVDANLTIIPISAVLSDKRISITEPTPHKNTAIYNNLVSAAKKFWNQMKQGTQNIFPTTSKAVSETSKDIVEGTKTVAKSIEKGVEKTGTGIEEGVKKIFSRNETNIPQATVVPVDQHLSVLSTLPESQVVTQTPVPKDSTWSKIESGFQNFWDKIFQSKSSNTATTSKISNNGYASIQKTQNANPSFY